MASDKLNGASRDSGKGGETQPEQLAAEIEQTREDLAATMDAIADRVSPKRVAKRSTKKVTDTVKETAHSAREAVTHAADAAKSKAGDLQGALHSGDDATSDDVIDVTDDALPGRHAADVQASTVVAGQTSGSHGVKSGAELVKEAAAHRISQVRGSTASGHSLSEPGQGGPVLLRKEVALGAVLAVVSLFLLYRRRSH